MESLKKKSIQKDYDWVLKLTNIMFTEHCSVVASVIFRLMISQTISWFAWFSTKITRNGCDLPQCGPLLIPDSLLSAHFTQSCSSLTFVRISIVTEYYHWLELFVQTLNVCVVREHLKCHEISNVTKYQMSRNLKCHEISNVTKS